MASHRKTIKTRILILSDTHAALPESSGDFHDTKQPEIPFHQPLPSADVLLHAGDLTLNGTYIQHQRALELISSVDAPLKIVIPGNHDITLDREYYKQYPTLHGPLTVYSDEQLAQIKELYDSPQARDAGIYYVEEGVRRFTLRNGARLNVYASAYQPEFCNWAFGYERGIDRFNPAAAKNPVPDYRNHGDGDRDDDGVATAAHDGAHDDENGEQHPDINVSRKDDQDLDIDIMLTHGPPQGILDTTNTGESVGCEHLRRAVERCRPLLHCFGHIHESWGAVVKRWDDDEKAAEKWKGVQGDDNDDRGDFKGKNPNMNYQAPAKTQKAEGEILLDPGTYESQKLRRGAYIDATGLEGGRETVFVNASVMSLGYEPLNAPWVVDVELPLSQTGNQDGDQ